MSEIIDLSYYRTLPQQFGAQPKFLVNEITNEIEYYCCTSPANAIIEYAFYKICEVCNIKHEKVYWGTDLKFAEDKFVTVTPFSLSKECIYLNEDEKIKNLNNKNELEFVVFLTTMLGATLWSDDIVGYVENNNFIKAFHYNGLFEIELALFVSKGFGTQLFFEHNLKKIISEQTNPSLQEFESYINNFINVKKHEWLDIFDFPENASFDKSKFWLLKKIGNVQRELILFLDK